MQTKMANNQQILDSFSRLALFENYLLPHIFGVNVLKAHHFDTTKRKIKIKIKIINEKKILSTRFKVTKFASFIIIVAIISMCKHSQVFDSYVIARNLIAR